MPDQTSEKAEVKMYSDFKSPYAYLAFDPGMALGQRFNVRVRWIPFQLRLKGKGERSVYSEYKVKYSYMDARRWAKPRGLWIRGPLKIYDTTPAAIGGLFAETQGRLLDFGRMAFKKFFLRDTNAVSKRRPRTTCLAYLSSCSRASRSGVTTGLCCSNSNWRRRASQLATRQPERHWNAPQRGGGCPGHGTFSFRINAARRR